MARTLLIMLAVLLLAPAHVEATDKNACRKVKAQIRKLEARMRRPYTAAQGVKLDERLRDLKARRYRVCR